MFMKRESSAFICVLLFVDIGLSGLSCWAYPSKSSADDHQFIADSEYHDYGGVGGTRFYDGHRVLRAYPETDEMRERLIAGRRAGGFDPQHKISKRSADYELWGDPHRKASAVGGNRRHLDLMTSSESFEPVERFLRENNVTHEVVIPNLGRFLRASTDPSACSKAPARPLIDPVDPLKFWTCYHSYQTLDDFIEELAEKYPSTASIVVIGKTSEDRAIKALKINTANSRDIFWIDGGMHAREWISPAVATYVAFDLLENYQSHKAVVDAFTWYIVPLLNADGYEFSRNENRLWRKTRTVDQAASSCVGIDPNRNFDFMWMVGASADPCSDVYAGAAPGTDPMVVALQSYLLGLKAEGNPVAYYTLHSFGQLWGCPWGFTDQTVPKTFADLMRVSNAGSKALRRVHGTTYSTGTTAQLGLIGGASDDWAFAVANFPFVYTIELRDTGVFEFALPANQILPSCEETVAGIKASAAEIRRILNEQAAVNGTGHQRGNNVGSGEAKPAAADPPVRGGDWLTYLPFLRPHFQDQDFPGAAILIDMEKVGRKRPERMRLRQN